MLQIEDKIANLQIRGYAQEMEFIQSDVFATAFVAGKGSGKTHSGALKTLSYCLANPGAHIMVTSPNYRILEFGTLPVYEKVFPLEFILHRKGAPHPEWRVFNGCRLSFWSTDKPENIVAGEVAGAHMDEASLSPYLAYTNVRSRMRQMRTDGTSYPYQLWITTTPRQLNWLYKEFVDNKNEDHKLIQASTKDNIYLDSVEAYIERLGVSGKQYEQDVEGQFESLAGDCLFRSDILERCLRDCDDPIETRLNGLIFIWKHPIVGAKYTGGADCADEGGEGVNDLIIMDEQGEEVAEIHGNISADRFAQLSNDLGREYNNTLIAPERNGTVGGRVCALLETLSYPNLYKDDKRKTGWYTTPTAYPPKVSRFTMLTEYEEAVRTGQTKIRSSDAIGEMSTFVRDEGGKYKHLPEYKDDMVMARAICWQMRKKRQGRGGGFFSFTRTGTTY